MRRGYRRPAGDLPLTVTDAAGRYEYNIDDTLQSVSYPNATIPTPTVGYVYDGQGRRVQKTAAGVTRTYIYDGEDILEERLGPTPTSRACSIRPTSP
jgi:hypothetical protein